VTGPRTLANLNGELLPLEAVRVPALDRGFLFGDAVYEVLRIYQGRPWLLEEHFQRLAQSLAGIRLDGVDLARLRCRLLDTIRAGSFQEAIAYLQVTRGAAPLREHAFPDRVQPLEFLYVQEFADPYGPLREQGAAAITHPDLRWQRCDIKSTNLLGNVLAAQAAAERDCLEALLYQADGTLTEGSRTSFFAVRDGVLLTSPQSHAILPGITRSLVLRLCAQAGVPVREQTLHRDDLTQVGELFLTGTTIEIVPLVRVDGQPVGNGRPGPITRRLQRAYADAVQRFLACPA
jgi:D-alanine transaminase